MNIKIYAFYHLIPACPAIAVRLSGSETLDSTEP